MNLTWADLSEGQEFVTATRTVTEGDVVSFAALTGDFSEVHVSRQFAEATPFGERIAHGLLSLSYSHGLMVNPGTFRECAIAFLGIEGWRFQAPVRLGDTIHVYYRIVQLRESRSKPDRGVMTLWVEVRNQHGATVQSGKQSLLLSKEQVGARPAAATGGATS
jgi:acyl dehydratase